MQGAFLNANLDELNQFGNIFPQKFLKKFLFFDTTNSEEMQNIGYIWPIF